MWHHCSRECKKTFIMVSTLKDTFYSTWLFTWAVEKLHASHLVSQASPIPFHSADRFQYRHAEEGSGDLGPLSVNSWNAIIG